MAECTKKTPSEMLGVDLLVAYFVDLTIIVPLAFAFIFICFGGSGFH